MTVYGWQQPPTCPHWGLLGAALTLGLHPAGHEWVCPCGARFVVTGQGDNKKLVRKGATMNAPPSSAVPTDLSGMTDGQVHELAEAYLNLMRLMTEALEVCETDYGFFSWSGRGFNITGHPPGTLVERLRA